MHNNREIVLASTSLHRRLYSNMAAPLEDNLRSFMDFSCTYNGYYCMQSVMVCAPIRIIIIYVMGYISTQ